MIELDRGWQPVQLYFCPSKKALRKFERGRPKYQRDNWRPDAAAVCYHYPETAGLPEVCVVACPKHEGVTAIQIAGLLAHECQHVLQHIFASMGEVAPSKEFEAYSMQSLLMSVMDAYEACHGVEWGLQ